MNSTSSPDPDTPPTAMVVDDSTSARHLIQHMLGSCGVESVGCGSVREALAALGRLPRPEILLVDWNMPVADGLVLVRAVRARDDGKHFRIMMVSAEGATENIRGALAAGADEYLIKPFTLDALKAKLLLLGNPL